MDSSYVLAKTWLLRYHRQCLGVAMQKTIIPTLSSDDPRKFGLRGEIGGNTREIQGK